MSIALLYDDHPGAWHEALLIYPGADRCWDMLTPDGDEYLEDDAACITGDGPAKAIYLDDSGALPAALAG